MKTPKYEVGDYLIETHDRIFDIIIVNRDKEIYTYKWVNINNDADRKLVKVWIRGVDGLDGDRYYRKASKLEKVLFELKGLYEAKSSQ